MNASADWVIIETSETLGRHEGKKTNSFLAQGSCKIIQDWVFSRSSDPGWEKVSEQQGIEVF